MSSSARGVRGTEARDDGDAALHRIATHQRHQHRLRQGRGSPPPRDARAIRTTRARTRFPRRPTPPGHRCDGDATAGRLGNGAPTAPCNLNASWPHFGCILGSTGSASWNERRRILTDTMPLTCASWNAGCRLRSGCAPPKNSRPAALPKPAHQPTTWPRDTYRRADGRCAGRRCGALATRPRAATPSCPAMRPRYRPPAIGRPAPERMTRCRGRGNRGGRRAAPSHTRRRTRWPA